jgi:hypothetical protein
MQSSFGKSSDSGWRATLDSRVDLNARRGRLQWGLETGEPSDPPQMGVHAAYGVVMQTDHVADFVEEFG